MHLLHTLWEWGPLASVGDPVSSVLKRSHHLLRLTPGRGLLTSFPWTLTDPRPSPLPSRNTDTRRSNKYTSACLKTFTCSLWTIKYIPNTPVEQHSKLLSYWALPTCPVLSLIALLNRPHSPGKLNPSSPPDTPFASCTHASAVHFHPRRRLPSFCPARSGSDATISNSSLLEIISPPSEQRAVMCPQWLSRIWLSATPWTVARQAPLSTGFPRQEHWNGLPFLPPGDLPHPGIKPASPASPELADRFFTTAPPEKRLQSGVAFCFYPSWGSYHTDCATVSRELLKKFTPWLAMWHLVMAVVEIFTPWLTWVLGRDVQVSFRDRREEPAGAHHCWSVSLQNGKRIPFRGILAKIK